MNPYYQNQYQYPQVQQPSHPQQQPQYTYPQPQPMAPPQGYNNNINIQAMYTTVQPYNSQEFLLNTVGNKIDYIKVFLTLPHEDKLMMYMLTEEKKMYGEIRDKDNYQRLLRDIAQKVHNYNLFHKGQTKEEKVDKSKELENKIDDIVEKTFEKLNVNAHNPDKEEEKSHQEVLLSEPN